MIDEPGAMKTSSAIPTALQLLIDWANVQDDWVRAIVGEVVATRRELPETSLAAAYELLLAEKGLSDESPRNVASLSAGENPSVQSDDFRLLRLADVAGV